MVDTTDVEGIIRLDCNVTDFYADRTFPTYLYYNPYDKEQTITYEANGNADLFDIVSKQYVARNVEKNTTIQLPAKHSRIIVELPAGTELTTDGTKVTTADGQTVSYK